MSNDRKSAIERLAEATRDKTDGKDIVEVADEEQCPNCGTSLVKSTADEVQEAVPNQASPPEPKDGIKFSDSWFVNLMSIIIGGIVLLGMCRGCSWLESYDWTCERNRKGPISLKKRIEDLKAFRFRSYGKKPFYCDTFFPKMMKKPKPTPAPPAPPPLPCPILDSKDLDCWPDIVREWETMQDGGVGTPPDSGATEPPIDGGSPL